ncbi:restriction endonuclease subunit S [Helicobacter winghamensis]|uniref:restriction endonuclease subunit S n=1 Tax=Helicobacter winghamensis TaxID=157268 RepID=UPI00351B8F6F
MIPKANRANLKFLEVIVNNIEIEQSGVNIPQLTVPQFSNVKIPLPPIAAQEKIVYIIESIESQIKRIDSKLEMLEKRKAEILSNALNAGNEREQAELKEILSEIESLLSQRKILQRFITTILQKAGLTQSLESLIDSLPTPPPQGWDTIKLNNKKYLTLNPSKREIANIDENTIVSFVEIASVADKGYIQNKVDKPLKELRKGSYTYFAENDILIAKITPCMENGKCAIAKNLANGLGMGSSEFHIFRTHKGLNNKFLFACLNQDSIRQEATKNMTGSSGHRRVPISFYESLQIPLPPIEAQEKIINTIENIESKISLLDSILSHLDSKKAEILQYFLKT